MFAKMKISPSSSFGGPDGQRGAGTRPQMAWTDFHTVLVIAHHGSVARACITLGMTHSTLLRKLDQIEHRMRTRMFERTRGQYTPTAAGAEVVEVAQGFETLAIAAETRISGQDLRPRGEVRVSAAPIVIEHLLAPALAQFGSAFPEIQIELSASRDYVSLRRREAEVAIRIADKVPDWLLGRKLAQLRFRVYGSSRSGADLPLRAVDALTAERRWISFERDAGDGKFDRWLASEVPASSVVLRVDNFSHAATMVRAGLGIALLPEFVEAHIDGLQPLSPPIAALQTPLWLITHPELKDATRVKVLLRAFGPALANAVNAAQAGLASDQPLA